MSAALIVECVLSLLLAATLVYCVLLERKLTALRKGQDGLKNIIADLDGAINNAGTSMRLLKSSAASAATTLDDRILRARALADELSVLTASGERIADRLVDGATSRPKIPGLPSGTVMNRLDSLRAAR